MAEIADRDSSAVDRPMRHSLGARMAKSPNPCRNLYYSKTKDARARVDLARFALDAVALDTAKAQVNCRFGPTPPVETPSIKPETLICCRRRH